MSVGTFSLVLHSHLPYYRKAGMWPFGEENLYEAMAETYLPLLVALEDLVEEGVSPKLTIGITPVLAEQLADEHLKVGFEKYVADIIERIEKDVHRYSAEGEREAAQWRSAEMRSEQLAAAIADWEQANAGDKPDVLSEAGDVLAALDALDRDFHRNIVDRPAGQGAGRPDASAPSASDSGLPPGGNPEKVPQGARGVTESSPFSSLSVGAGASAIAGQPSHPVDCEVTVAGLAQAVAETEARAGAAETQGELGRVVLTPATPPTLDDIPEVPLTVPEQPDPRAELSKWYLDWYRQRLSDFQERFGRDLLAAFRRLQEQGAIEIITCAATHGFSPLFSRDSTLNAQYSVAVQTHERHFGRRPTGVWLPECAYRPGYEDARDYRPPVEQFLHAQGLKYFFTDAHAVVGGKTSGYRRHIGLYGNIEFLEMPERPLSGLDTFHGYWLPEHPVAFYARNERAGWQVWSADMGYPGDPWYREFHKRDGNSGMSYWRITGSHCELHDKDFYNPQMALQRIHEHSDHYVSLIHDMLKGYQDANGEPGHVVVPFDTELFGHWWFEGIEWIKQVVRKMAQGSGIRRVTIGELHTDAPPTHAFQLPESSWGAGGHYHVWMNPEVEWMWPIIHRCERRMEELVRMYPEPPSSLIARGLAQAARELLLLEGSDWPFLVTTGQARTYAIDRFNEHVERFDALADGLMTGAVSAETLESCEGIDNLFPDIDYRLFADRQEAAGRTR